MTKALIIGAPRSGSGKTSVTIGLLRALKRRGVAVAGAKSGPDYIDPGFHEAATGRPGVNLDTWAMPPVLLGALAQAQAREAEILRQIGVDEPTAILRQGGARGDLAAGGDQVILIGRRLSWSEGIDGPVCNLDQRCLRLPSQAPGFRHQELARATAKARRMASSPLPSAKSPRRA